MKKLFRKIKEKLKEKFGESISESLVTVAIISFGAICLAGFVSLSGKMMTTGDKIVNTFYSEEALLDNLVFCDIMPEGMRTGNFVVKSMTSGKTTTTPVAYYITENIGLSAFRYNK